MATPNKTFELNGKEYPAICCTLFADTDSEMETCVATSDLNNALCEVFDNDNSTEVQLNAASYIDNQIVFFVTEEQMKSMSNEEIIKLVESEISD